MSAPPELSCADDVAVFLDFDGTLVPIVDRPSLTEVPDDLRTSLQAVHVNPYDIDGVADGIHQALGMPLGERKERYDSMIAVLRKNDITAWRTRFVDTLIATHERVRLAS